MTRDLAEVPRFGLHVGVAAICLGVFAWAGAEGPGPQAPGSSVVLRCEQLTELRYQNGDRSVALTTEGERVWIDLEVGAPRDVGPHGSEQAGAGRLRAARLRGNERAEEVASDFQLVAIRDIGTLDETQARAVGLGASADNATLSVRCDGSTHEYAIGIGAYGSASRYVRHDGDVLLVDGTLLNELEIAEMRLVERRLLLVSPNDAVRAEIEVGGETLQLTQLERRSARARWVDSAAPETRRRDYDRLMRAIFGLSVEGALGEGGAPDLAESEPVCGARLYGMRDALLGEVRVGRVEAGPTGAIWVGSSDQREATRLLPTSGASLARAVDRLGDAAEPAH